MLGTEGDYLSSTILYFRSCRVISYLTVYVIDTTKHSAVMSKYTSILEQFPIDKTTYSVLHQHLLDEALSHRDRLYLSTSILDRCNSTRDYPTRNDFFNVWSAALGTLQQLKPNDHQEASIAKNAINLCTAAVRAKKYKVALDATAEPFGGLFEKPIRDHGFTTSGEFLLSGAVALKVIKRHCAPKRSAKSKGLQNVLSRLFYLRLVAASNVDESSFSTKDLFTFSESLVVPFLNWIGEDAQPYFEKIRLILLQCSARKGCNADFAFECRALASFLDNREPQIVVGILHKSALAYIRRSDGDSNRVLQSYSLFWKKLFKNLDLIRAAVVNSEGEALLAWIDHYVSLSGPKSGLKLYSALLKAIEFRPTQSAPCDLKSRSCKAVGSYQISETETEDVFRPFREILILQKAMLMSLQTAKGDITSFYERYCDNTDHRDVERSLRYHLRLIRALEPHRKYVCSSNRPKGASIVQLYVTVFERGNSLAADNLAEKFKKARGALLEGYQWLLTQLSQENEKGTKREFVSQGELARSILKVAEGFCDSTKDDRQCAQWAAKVIHNCAVTIYNREMAKSERSGLRDVGELMRQGLRCLETYSDKEVVAKRLAHTITTFIACGSSCAQDAAIVATQALEYLRCGGDLTSELLVAIGRATILKYDERVQLQYDKKGSDFLEAYYTTLREYERHLTRRGFSGDDRRLVSLRNENLKILGNLKNVSACKWIGLAWAWLSFSSKFWTAHEYETHLRTVNDDVIGEDCARDRATTLLTRLWVLCSAGTLKDDTLDSLDILIKEMMNISKKDIFGSELRHLGMDICLWASIKLTANDLDNQALRLARAGMRLASLLQLERPVSQIHACNLLRRLGLTTQALESLDSQDISMSVLVEKAKISNDLLRYQDAQSTLSKCGTDVKQEDKIKSEMSGTAAAQLHSTLAIALLYGEFHLVGGLKESLRALKRLVIESKTASEDGINVGGILVSLQTGTDDDASLSKLKALGEVLLQVAEGYTKLCLRSQASYYIERSRQVLLQVGAPACIMLGTLAMYLYRDAFADYEEELKTLEDPRLLAPALNPLLRARIFSRMGEVHFAQKSSSLAMAWYTDALALLKEIPYETKITVSLVATINVRRGLCFLKDGNLSLAKETLKLAMEGNLAPDDGALALLSLAKCSIAEAGTNVLEYAWSNEKKTSLCSSKDLKRGMKLLVEARSQLEQADELISSKHMYTDPRLLRKIRILQAELTIGKDIKKALALLFSSQRPALALRRDLQEQAGAWNAHENSRAIAASESYEVNSRGDSYITEVEQKFERMNISAPRTYSWKYASEGMPANWVLLGVTINETRTHLLIWRVRRGSCSCVMRLALPDADSGSSYTEVRRRFDDIMHSMKSSTSPGDTKNSSEVEKALWWRSRFELDNLLMHVVTDIEKKWLQQAIALFLPPQGNEIKDDESDDLSRELNEVISLYPNTIDGNSAQSSCTIHMEGHPAMDIGQLLHQSKKTTSKRPRTRRATQKLRRKTPRDGAQDTDAAQGKLVLMLDSELEWIPWESMPSLRQYTVPVTRILDLEAFFLRQSMERCTQGCQLHVDPRNTYFVLNPTGDLEKTEKTFAQPFRKQVGWKGVIGKEEAKPGIVDDLMSREIFIYCGHGGGETIVSAKHLRSRKVAPIALLMGCSSAKLNSARNEFGLSESEGIVADYSLAGTPAVLGNLWDVTDRDIDRLTTSLLHRWLRVQISSTEHASTTHMDLSKALAGARGACRLPYLVAAATVNYGLPGLRTV